MKKLLTTVFVSIVGLRGETMIRRIGLFGALACAAGLTLAASAAPAGAASKVGETFDPEGSWGGSGVMIQVGAPGDINVVPRAGVLTSWSFEATTIEATPPLKMKVMRHASGDDFTTVADSQLQTPMQGVLNTWPTRIPVNAGDLLALFFTDDTYGYGNPEDPQYVTQEISGAPGDPSVDPPPGMTTTFESPDTPQRVDVSAMLEADADHDGYGDETQDQCPSNGGTQGPCPVAQHKKKCKKHKKKHHSAQSAKKKKCKKHKK